MKILSIDTETREDDQQVALVPWLEELPGRSAGAGFDWQDGELIGAGAAAAPLTLDILDLPYPLDHSAHLGGLADDGSLDFSPRRPRLDLGDDLSLVGLPGLSRSVSWNVAEVETVGDGFAEVALTGPDGNSFLAATYEDDLGHIEPGRPILGLERALATTQRTARLGEAAVHTPIGLGRKYVLRMIPVEVDFLPDQPPRKAETWVPVARAHCPAPDGCRAQFCAGGTTTSEQTATLSVLGSGAESVHRIKLDQSRSLAAEPGKCMELAVPGVLQIQSGATRVGGEPFVYGLRLSMKSLNENDVHERPIAAEYDECGWPPEQLPEDPWRLNRTEATSKADGDPHFHQEIEQETSGALSVGLTFNQVPISLGLDFKRSSAQRDIVDAWLAPGAAYAAYHPGGDRTMEWCWAVSDG